MGSHWLNQLHSILQGPWHFHDSFPGPAQNKDFPWPKQKMSTQLRRIAQSPVPTPARSRFFLAIDALSGCATSLCNPSLSEVVYLNNDGSFESVMTTTEFNDNFTEGAGQLSVIEAGALLKDLGREVNVIGADGNRLSKYRQVQIVNGTGSEGVGGTAGTAAPDPWNSNLFVRVWAADGNSVNVVRTG